MLRRFAPALLTLVGLVFAVVGAVMLYSLTWDKATGTVQACEAQMKRAATGTSSSLEYQCQVRWEADGASHTTTVNAGRDAYGQGHPIDLRVHGGSAVVDTPGWVGAASLGGGLVLAGAGVFMFLRARRTT